MFWQQPLLLGGVAGLIPFFIHHRRAAVLWLGVYLSLIVPNSLELARFGGGGPSGRFGWSAEWLWIVPLGLAFRSGGQKRTPVVRRVVLAALAYQALAAVRWSRDPSVLFTRLDSALGSRDSLFPVPLRNWLPSFYFWDFASYWTYPANIAGFAVLLLILLSGAYVARRMSGERASGDCFG